MYENPYLLRGLPQLPDHLLLRTVAAYRQAQDVLLSSGLPEATSMSRQLREALATISEELRARGISSRSARRLRAPNKTSLGLRAAARTRYGVALHRRTAADTAASRALSHVRSRALAWQSRFC